MYITPVSKDNKSLRSQNTFKVKDFLNFFACWWNNYEPGSWRPKTYGYGTLPKISVYTYNMVILCLSSTSVSTQRVV
jgi:hypothetical protein